MVVLENAVAKRRGRGCCGGGVRWPGSTKFIDNLVAGLDKQPSYLINATQCLPLEPAIRSMTGTYLQGIKSEDLVYHHHRHHQLPPLPTLLPLSHMAHIARPVVFLCVCVCVEISRFRYALLIADGKLVNFVQPKRHPLKPEGTAPRAMTVVVRGRGVANGG